MSDRTHTQEQVLPGAWNPAAFRRPIGWIYALLVIVGLVLIVPRFAGMIDRPEYMLIAGVGALLQAIVLVLLGWIVLPRRRARASTVLASVLIGATLCTGVAIQILTAADGIGINRIYAASFVEEPIKLAAVAVILVMLGSSLRGPLDGLIAGFFVGLGFAVVENVLYTFGADSSGHAWLLVFSRLVTQIGGHVVFSGIAGAALAYLFVTRGRGWGLASAGFVVALGLHFFWDALLLWVPSIVYLGLVVVLTAAGIVLLVVVKRMGVSFERGNRIAQ